MLCRFACVECGKDVYREIDDDAVEYMSEVYAPYIKCPECVMRSERELAEAREAERRRREELEAAERIERGMVDSGLSKYELAYDPDDPRGNRELFSWVSAHREGCLWVAGRTGLCKSRILQYWGRQALRTRSVQYWPTMDLLAFLSENAKNITRLLEQIYRVDLLILDDLGTECVTEARMKYLFNIIDRRVTGFEQKRRGLIGRKLGWQLWISTNDSGRGLMKSMGEYGEPCIRRLQENCNVWEKW